MYMYVHVSLANKDIFLDPIMSFLNEVLLYTLWCGHVFMYVLISIANYSVLCDCTCTCTCINSTYRVHTYIHVCTSNQLFLVGIKGCLDMTITRSLSGPKYLGGTQWIHGLMDQPQGAKRIECGREMWEANKAWTRRHTYVYMCTCIQHS